MDRLLMMRQYPLISYRTSDYPHSILPFRKDQVLPPTNTEVIQNTLRMMETTMLGISCDQVRIHMVSCVLRTTLNMIKIIGTKLKNAYDPLDLFKAGNIAQLLCAAFLKRGLTEIFIGLFLTINKLLT